MTKPHKKKRTKSSDPCIRWIPFTARDAMTLSTLSVITRQQGLILISETLEALALAYDDCYLDVDPDLLEQ